MCLQNIGAGNVWTVALNNLRHGKSSGSSCRIKPFRQELPELVRFFLTLIYAVTFLGSKTGFPFSSGITDTMDT